MKKTATQRLKSKSKQSKRTLHKKVWDVFSKCVRLRAITDNEYVQCFTCSAVKKWTEMQAGHFKHGKLDFDPLNIHPQCQQCNGFKHGKLDVYGIKLAQTYGLKTVIDLEKRAAQHEGYSYSELENLLKLFTEEFEFLTALKLWRS